MGAFQFRQRQSHLTQISPKTSLTKIHSLMRDAAAASLRKIPLKTRGLTRKRVGTGLGRRAPKEAVHLGNILHEEPCQFNTVLVGPLPVYDVNRKVATVVSPSSMFIYLFFGCYWSLTLEFVRDMGTSASAVAVKGPKSLFDVPSR